MLLRRACFIRTVGVIACVLLAGPAVLQAATITTNDLGISISDAGPVVEGNAGTTDVTFKVSLSAPSTDTVTVGYGTADGSAKVSNSDYIAASGTLTFLPGEVSQTVTVKVNGDGTLEGDEHFVVNLSNPVNGSLADSVGDGTILNDDGAPTVSIGDVTAIEGNTGLKQYKFVVTLSSPTDQSVIVTSTRWTERRRSRTTTTRPRPDATRSGRRR